MTTSLTRPLYWIILSVEAMEFLEYLSAIITALCGCRHVEVVLFMECCAKLSNGYSLLPHIQERKQLTAL